MCIRDRVKDAEVHAEEDKVRKEEVEVRNNCDSLINATETTLGEVGDKVSPEVKQQAESAVAQGKAALEGTDIEAIKAAIEAMQQAGYKLAEVVYGNQDAAQATAGAAGAQQPADDDTIEADFEVCLLYTSSVLAWLVETTQNGSMPSIRANRSPEASGLPVAAVWAQPIACGAYPSALRLAVSARFVSSAGSSTETIIAAAPMGP